MQTEELGRSRAATVDPIGQAEVSLDDLLVDEREPGLDAGHPSGDLGEIAPAATGEPGALVRRSERTVVGRYDLQVAALESLPQLLRVVRVAQRGSADVAGGRGGSVLVTLRRQVEVLRASLGIEVQTAFTSDTNALEGRSARQVHDVTRGAGVLGESDCAQDRVRLCLGRPRFCMPARLSMSRAER